MKKAKPLTPKQWFKQQGWKPFPFQEEVWAAYAEGASGLIHSSTGSGKTYAAYFGPLLDALQRSDNAVSPLKVLWLTPLRALSSDTALSLAAPLESLGFKWDVGIRTGDTKASIRAKQRKRLPTVLVTTPESLSLFLTHSDSAERFANLQAVIVDEWHELLGSKRGVLTELALARLRAWQPNLRIWGLSATLGNIDTALSTLLGPNHRGRIVRGHLPKVTTIDSLLPPTVERFPWAGHLGLTLIAQVVAAIDDGRSALVFTNTRSQTEIWYQALLAERPDWAGLIALHHGSIDRKSRDWVEEQLRQGTLRCVVCTSSLDLGVDFSPVDRVIQIGSPKGVARLLQRAGRSGHQPGATSRVTCVPTSALELIEVAAARNAAKQGQIEGRTPISKPLDLLAQHVVSTSIAGTHTPEMLMDEVRTTHAYAELSDAEWAWVLEFVMNGGESLKAYPDYKRVQQPEKELIIADSRTARLHRMAIGTIMSDASIQVRFVKGARLGSVEESFIAKLKKGDRFTFAGRVLEFVRVREMTAWVKKATRKSTTVARWSGGRMPLSNELAIAVRNELNRARQGVFDSPEMLAVKPILEIQRRWSTIPAPSELLVERLRSREGYHLFIYPFDGRLAHEGLAALAAYRLAQRQPMTFTMSVNDYGFELLSDCPIATDETSIRFMMNIDELTTDILDSINAGEMVKRQFREVARVAGLIHPGMPNAGRTNRQLQASSGLFYEVFREYDPRNMLLHQARQEVLDRQFEVSRLKQSLDRIAASKIVIRDLPRASPFAFPLMVQRLRESLSTEKLADRIKRMTVELERHADTAK